MSYGAEYGLVPAKYAMRRSPPLHFDPDGWPRLLYPVMRMALRLEVARRGVDARLFSPRSSASLQGAKPGSFVTLAS